MAIEDRGNDPMSEMDAIASLMETQEVQPELEVEEDETDEADEEAEPIEAEAEEGEPVEDDEGQAEDDESEEVETEDDDPLIVIQTKRGTEEVRFSELQDGYMRMKDYTQKTQELADQRRSFDEERGKAVQQIRQQQTQLQEALATFAIDQVQEPDWENVKPEDYPKVRAQWENKLRKKQQATEQYRALVQQQQEETLRREQEALLGLFPEWRDPAVFGEVAREFVNLGGEYGFSPEEMAALTDHRMFRVLHDLKQAKAKANVTEQNKAAIAKRVAKAAKKPAPGSKPAKNQAEGKKRQAMRDQLKRTGDPNLAAQWLLQG